MKIAAKLLLLSIATLSWRAEAGPVGPSAAMAARLKNHPTSEWLAHYLPDDRYKIAGGIWKYVSTDLDTYYHSPQSPLMMRQSADRVIGFSSAAEAEEAGYKAAPDVNRNPVFPAGAASSGGSSQSRSIVLSDGSRIMLPAGWSHQKGPTQKMRGGDVVVDVFKGPRREAVAISSTTLNIPVPIDLSRFFTVDYLNSLRAQSPGLDAMQAQTSTAKVRLNGMEGIGVYPKVQTAGQSAGIYLFGRGKKMWAIVNMSPNNFKLATFLKTLRLR